jgi:hypothetical protein
MKHFFGFITSESSPEKPMISTETGAVFLLTKPFTVDCMQALLEFVLA